jgi:hypothetical protein
MEQRHQRTNFGFALACYSRCVDSLDLPCWPTYRTLSDLDLLGEQARTNGGVNAVVTAVAGNR